MQEAIESIKKGVRGVIGSFVIEGGKVLASDMPELLNEEIGKVSFNVSFLIEQVTQSRGLEKLQITAEDGSMIIVSDGKTILCCVASKEANLGLLTLLAKKALSIIAAEIKEKGLPKPEVQKPVAAEAAPKEVKKEAKKEDKKKEIDLDKLIGSGGWA